MESELGLDEDLPEKKSSIKAEKNDEMETCNYQSFPPNLNLCKGP